jgi:hypothetical protein
MERNWCSKLNKSRPFVETELQQLQITLAWMIMQGIVHARLDARIVAFGRDSLLPGQSEPVQRNAEVDINCCAVASVMSSQQLFSVALISVMALIIMAFIAIDAVMGAP